MLPKLGQSTLSCLISLSDIGMLVLLLVEQLIGPIVVVFEFEGQSP